MTVVEVRLRDTATMSAVDPAIRPVRVLLVPERTAPVTRRVPTEIGLKIHAGATAVLLTEISNPTIENPERIVPEAGSGKSPATPGAGPRP